MNDSINEIHVYNTRLNLKRKNDELSNDELLNDTNNINTNKRIKKNDHKIKFIDLFCSIGSFHYSFDKLGWECVMACDIDKNVKETYKLNYNMEPLSDIKQIDLNSVPYYDILCAGFPCQPFSQMGNRKGFKDKRGTGFFDILKFITKHNPKILILENVPGLMTHINGKTFSKIIKDINDNGYTTTYDILKCSDYGIPQMRRRVFIIGVRNNLKLVSVIDKLLKFNEYEKNVSLSEFFNKNFKRETAKTIRCGGYGTHITDSRNWREYYVDNKVYALTPKDCLRLQGFEPSFKLYGYKTEIYKQLGNTIPTIFTEMIGENIKKYISLIN